MCMPNEGFISVIVTYEDNDMELTLNFRNNVLVNEFITMVEENTFESSWLASFVGQCEVILVPRVQLAYEKMKGCPWKNPLKMKLRKTNINNSSTPSSSTVRGSIANEPPKGQDTTQSAGDAAVPIDSDSRVIVPTEEALVPNLAPTPTLPLPPVPSPACAPPSTSSQGG